MTIQAQVRFFGIDRSGQSVHVYLHGTTTHATIFDTDGVTTIPNPVRVTTQGFVNFAADPDTYDCVSATDGATVVVELTTPPAPSGGGTGGPEVVETFTSSGAAVTLGDLATTGTVKNITVTADCVITLPPTVVGQAFTVNLIQGGSGGWSVTWTAPAGTTLVWPGGAAPTVTTVAGGRDKVVFDCSLATVWDGSPAGYDYR